jgi:hypothetical protein
MDFCSVIRKRIKRQSRELWTGKEDLTYAVNMSQLAGNSESFLESSFDQE